jgi:hypothetical protein
MSTLAFDPERVEALRRRMEMAVAELRSMRSDDPVAAAALHRVVVATEELEEVWLPFVARLTDSVALLLPGDRRAIGHLDNALAWVMTKGYGWTAATDPLASGPVDPATARALGARLSAIDPVTLSRDSGAMTELTRALRQVAADGRLADDLLRNWTSLARFADVLGDVRSRAMVHDPSVTADRQAIDGVFAQLAQVLSASSMDPLPLLDRLSPFTAASMAAALDLDDDQLARVTDGVVRRAGLVEDAVLEFRGRPRAADLLLPLIAARPHAARALAMLSAGHADDLLAAATDRTAVYRLLLEATDPRVMTVADAGKVVPQMVVEFVRGGVVDDAAFVADLITPWTAQFAAGNHDWPLSEEERHGLLAAAMQDSDALARFVHNVDAVLRAATEHFRTATYDTKVELTSYVGMIGDIVMNGKLREESDKRRGWNLLAGAASIGASLITGVAVGLMATAAVMYLTWKTAPNPHKAAHAAIWNQDVELTMLAAAQVHALDHQLRVEGSIPASMPLPPRADPNRVGGMPSMGFIEAMGPWIRQLPGGEDGTISLKMQQAMFMYINPADSEIRGMEYVRGR